MPGRIAAVPGDEDYPPMEDPPMHDQALELHRRIWEWLPGRADRGRLTDPASVALAMTTSVHVAASALAAMETGGHAVRDRAGHRAGHWHRGTPLPLAIRGGPTGDGQASLWP